MLVYFVFAINILALLERFLPKCKGMTKTKKYVWNQKLHLHYFDFP